MRSRASLVSLSLILLGAISSAILTGCAKDITGATKGALAGAALGAGSGAIIGSQTGNAGAGVAIGAGIGALGGAIAGNSIDQMDQENEALESQYNKNQAQIEENRRLIDELRKSGADVRSSTRGVVINLPDILFQFDRAELTAEAHRTLEEVSSVLESVKDRPISVEGHTDSIGSVTYNKDLSHRRAQATLSKLTQAGIARGQMQAIGYGEGKPLATNNTESGRSRNRRVEIIVENN